MANNRARQSSRQASREASRELSRQRSPGPSEIPTQEPSAELLQRAVDEAKGSADKAKESATLACEEADRARDEVTSQMTTAEDEAKQNRQDWFPLLATALALNIAIWLSLIFQVYDIQHNQSQRIAYEIVAWVAVFGGVTIVLLLFIWSREPSPLRTFREKETWPRLSTYIATLANAFFCFSFVIIYLRADAIPKYNTSEWESHIGYNDSLFPPAFAFASGGDFNDTALASFVGGTTLCTFPQYSKTNSTGCPVAAFNRTRQTLDIRSEAYGHLDAYIFNPHELLPKNNTYVDLTDRVLLQVNVNYNSDDLEGDYTAQMLQIPYIFAVIYDPRIDLATALHCGLVAFTEIPAMGANTITLSAQHVTDDLGVVKPSDDKSTCSKIYTSALTMKNPPYTSYSFRLGSMPTSDLSICDTKLSSNASCISQVLLRYGSRVVSSWKAYLVLPKLIF
ncbi:hypothetical protein EDD36DRAFT_439843 [Exophiala viscosa]|uniref:Uncharacterized protein n=1 Tax=Exophiala viscosa TaxID=2486360 RepID=A0AAN6DSW3_9EURO|nr:hypothetical protein EDD36DRAFT_439843 [Exophiala viscosa]